jgi:hypothetical protein
MIAQIRAGLCALIGFSQRYTSMFQRRYSLLAKSSASAPDAKGAKKRAAKARQQAIMVQMKAQQENFGSISKTKTRIVIKMWTRTSASFPRSAPASFARKI